MEKEFFRTTQEGNSILCSLSSVMHHGWVIRPIARINRSASNLVMHFLLMRNLGAFLFQIGVNVS